MTHNIVSDQGLHCLRTGISIKNRIKVKKNRPDTPKMTHGLVQHITVEESTSIQLVNSITHYMYMYITDNLYETESDIFISFMCTLIYLVPSQSSR